MEQDIKATRGKLSSLTLSYAAGFIDADGCITIAKVHNRYGNIKGKMPSYYLRIVATGINKDIIVWFKETFNGSVACKVSKHGESCYLPHHRVQWIWETSGNMALETLIKLEPYLKVKRDQAVIGIEFQKNKANYFEHNRGKIIPDNIANEREILYKKMRELKAKGETLETYRSRRD